MENLFFRQYLAVVRVGGFLEFLRGKSEWGSMEKRGFAKAEPLP
jgi:hypothetical protein